MNNMIHANIPQEYAMAYVEICEVLKRMEEMYYNKIPQYILDKFENLKSNSYKFKYDNNKELKDQKLMPKTKDILAMLFIDYLASENEKQIIKEKQQEYKTQKEKKLQEKYDINELFQKKNRSISKQNTYLVEYKKPLYLRILNKIKNILKKY